MSNMKRLTPGGFIVFVVMVGLLLYRLLYVIIGTLAIVVFNGWRLDHETISGWALALTVLLGALLYVVVGKAYDEQVQKDIKESETFVGTEGDSILLKCRATYVGGHKKFGDPAFVYVVLTTSRLFIKEETGSPETRIDIPIESIVDFGIGTKESLSASTLLLVGILAFAMKKKSKYLYVKYRDHLGFDHNPVLGDFVGATPTDISRELYRVIETQETPEIHP